MFSFGYFAPVSVRAGSRAAAHRHRDEALVVDKAGPVPALGREKRKFDQLIGSHRASNSGFNGLYVQAPGTG